MHASPTSLSLAPSPGRENCASILSLPLQDSMLCERRGISSLGPSAPGASAQGLAAQVVSADLDQRECGLQDNVSKSDQ